MEFGFTRRIEEKYIDLDKMAQDGKIDRKIEDSPNGYYPSTIVPNYLIGKLVLIIPINEHKVPEKIEHMKEETENPSECPFLVKTSQNIACTTTKYCPKSFYRHVIRPKCWNLTDYEFRRAIYEKRKSIPVFEQCTDDTCDGELVFSHQIANEDRTRVYHCNKCGKRKEYT